MTRGPSPHKQPPDSSAAPESQPSRGDFGYRTTGYRHSLMEHLIWRTRRNLAHAALQGAKLTQPQSWDRGLLLQWQGSAPASSSVCFCRFPLQPPLVHSVATRWSVGACRNFSCGSRQTPQMLSRCHAVMHRNTGAHTAPVLDCAIRGGQDRIPSSSQLSRCASR